MVRIRKRRETHPQSSAKSPEPTVNSGCDALQIPGKETLINDGDVDGKESALDGLVRAILSQNSTQIDSERAFASLKRAFPSWNDVLAAESKCIEDTIRCEGLAPAKSSCIKNLLSSLLDKRGKLSMGYLRELSVEEDKVEQPKVSSKKLKKDNRESPLAPETSQPSLVTLTTSVPADSSIVECKTVAEVVQANKNNMLPQDVHSLDDVSEKSEMAKADVVLYTMADPSGVDAEKMVEYQEDEIATLKAEKKSFVAERKSFEEQKRKWIEAHERNELEIGNLRAQVDEVTKVHSEALERNELEIRNLRAQVDEATKVNSEALERNELEIRNLRAQVDELTKVNSEARERNELEIRNLRAQVDEATKVNSEALERNELEIGNLRAQVDELTNVNSDLSQSVEQNQQKEEAALQIGYEAGYTAGHMGVSLKVRKEIPPLSPIKSMPSSTFGTGINVSGPGATGQNSSTCANSEAQQVKHGQDSSTYVNSQAQEVKVPEVPILGRASNGNTDTSEHDASSFDVLVGVPDPDFHDFDVDITASSFGENEVWAIYDEDGMPRFYVLINEVISRDPFQLRISWLNSTTTTEFSNIDWVGSGFHKTCGEFSVGRRRDFNFIDSFSQRLHWSKGPHGGVLILPQKNDVWALYRDWSPDWDKNTPREVMFKYDMVLVLDDYTEEHGLHVAPLVKVVGFRTVFRPNLDPQARKRILREEMFRFSHRVPIHLLTGQEGKNVPKGCLELDPAATPLELLKKQMKEDEMKVDRIC